MTIRKRLTLWYAGLLTLTIIVVGVFVFSMTQRALIASIDTTLDETAIIIEASSDFALPDINPDGTQSTEIEIHSLEMFNTPGVEAQVWLAQGDTWYLTMTSANIVNYLNALNPQHLGSETIQYQNLTIDDNRWRVRTSPLVIDGTIKGSLQVAESLHFVNQALQGLLLIIVIGCSIAIFATAIVSFWLAGRVLQPIEDVTAAAAYVAGTKDLSTRLEWIGAMDEVGELSHVFNTMMERLEHLFSVQQRFVADVSHELRTPITAIRGNVEIMRRYGMDQDALEAIHAESERMSRLVNDLLLLARADYGGLEVDKSLLDLDTVLMDAFQGGRGLVANRDVDFKLLQVEPLRVNGNADRLKQMILNLVDNALKFTPDSGEITLSLYRVQEHALIEVSDTGVGIDEEELPRIFDRFYQTDPARAHEGIGFGLGLSIVQWILDVHEGKAIVTSKKNEGTTFKLMIPLYKSDKVQRADTHAQITKTHVAISRRKPDPSPGQ